MNYEWKDKLKWVLSQLENLEREYPYDSQIESAIKQVRYILALANGTESDDSRLETIMLGWLAMYPLSDIVSNDLSAAMCDISGKIRRELRRQGRQLNIDRR